jgi:hypothetical protein
VNAFAERRLFLDIHVSEWDVSAHEQDGKTAGWSMVLSHAFPTVGSLDIRHSLDKKKMKGVNISAFGTLPFSCRVCSGMVQSLVMICLALYPYLSLTP